MQKHTDPQRAERRHSDSMLRLHAKIHPPPSTRTLLPAAFGCCGLVVKDVQKYVGLNPTRVEHHCHPEACLILGERYEF